MMVSERIVIQFILKCDFIDHVAKEQNRKDKFIIENKLSTNSYINSNPEWKLDINVQHITRHMDDY